MERRAPADRTNQTEDLAHADTAAAPLEAIADLTQRDAARPSKREGGKGAAYGSVTGEVGRGDVAASTPMPTVGEAVRYEPGPLLGQGGMGEVVLALDHRIGRHVARKTLLKEVHNERTISRFVREVRVQGQLEHPSIVPVYDFGVAADGAPYFTMKRVRGETLAHLLERVGAGDPGYVGRYSRHKLLAAFRQVCLAVEYAHMRGVVHRDLKPSNIMLGDFGEVYVLDWGLAKLRTDGAAPDPGSSPSLEPPLLMPFDAQKTAEGDMVGTPAYMAPEQFGAAKNRFDARQDIFALGAILFEILTLARYRPGDSFQTLLPNLLSEANRDRPTRPSDKVPDVAPELDEACARALSTQPGARIDSAGAIGEVIERYLEGDRDQGVRREMARKLLDAARKQVEEGKGEAAARVDAMRGALKALALTPDDVEAQRLLLSLVVEGSGKLPPEAEAEFEESDVDVDAHRARLGLFGLASWFVVLPVAILVGIRDWLTVGIMIALVLSTMVYLAVVLRLRTRATPHVLALAALLSATLSLTSEWLGPFVLVPVAICGISVIFASRCTPQQRPWLLFIWALGVLVPFGLELFHVFPPAYTFRGGEIILHPRLLDLPEGATLGLLAYTSVTFVIFPMGLLGTFRDRQRDGDRRQFVQAWHLRQLFPNRTDW